MKEPQRFLVALAVIMPGIIAMAGFKPYNIETPSVPNIIRKEPANIEIWEGGFQVEDYEEAALRAYYADPETMLKYFMESKVYARRKAFVKTYETSFFERQEAIPLQEDDYINSVCSRVDYKTRIERDEEVNE